MAEVKLVAESLSDFENSTKKEKINEEEQLNEGKKEALVKFVNDPSRKKKLLGAFAKQINQVKGLKNAILKLSDEDQIKIAKNAIEVLKSNPKIEYLKLGVANNKLTGKVGGVSARHGAIGTNA